VQSQQPACVPFTWHLCCPLVLAVPAAVPWLRWLVCPSFSRAH
jgi:hypothetical protein